MRWLNLQDYQNIYIIKFGEILFNFIVIYLCLAKDYRNNFEEEINNISIIYWGVFYIS